MTGTTQPLPAQKFCFILGLLIAGIFLIDLLTPLGSADGVLYIAAVLFSLRQRNSRLLFGVALGCSTLALAGYGLSPESGEWWMIIWNRGLALVAIWTTATMGNTYFHQVKTIGPRGATFQDFMNTMPCTCFTFDRQGIILSWNLAAERIYGFSHQEAIGAYSWDQIVTPETREATQQAIEAVFNGQTLYNRVWQDRNMKGEQGWRLGNLFPIFDEQGQILYGANVDVPTPKAAEGCLVTHHNLLQELTGAMADSMVAKDQQGNTIGLVGVSRDATDFKNSRRELILSELVFNASPDHISVVGRDYRYRRVNPTYERVHGKTKEELVGLSVADLLGKEVFTHQVQPLIDRCFQGEEVHYESWFTFQDGASRYMAVSYIPLLIPDKDSEEIVVIARDWTERKTAEEAVKASEQRLRTTLDAMTNFVGIGTVDGIILECNQAPLTLAGLQREDVIGKRFIDTYWLSYSPDVQEQIRTILHRVAQGEIVREDVRARMGENQYVTVDACYVPVKDSKGNVVQIVHSGIDVTARRNVEQALRESKQRLQAILDHSPNLIFMKDLAGRYLLVNKQFEQVFHLTQKSVLGFDDFHLFPPTQAAQFHTHDRMVFQTEETLQFEEKALHDDGVHTSLVQKFPLQDETGSTYAIGGIATDITDRKRAEECLRNSEERFRKYFESGLVGMAITTVNKTLLEVNDRMCAILGYSREELLGKDWSNLTHPDDLAEYRTFFNQLIEGDLDSFVIEKRYLRKDRSTIHANLYMNAVKNKTGSVEYITTMVQDLTVQKEAQLAIRAAEQLSLATMNALSAYICVLNDHGTIIMVNDGWKQFVKDNACNPDRVGVGDNYFSFFSHITKESISDTAQTVPHILEVLEGKKKEFSFEFPSCHSPTTQRWFACRVTRFLGPGSLRVVVAHQDITERRHMENALRSSESTLKTFFDSAPMMMGVVEISSHDVRHLSDNKATARFYGQVEGGVTGKWYSELHISQDIMRIWIDHYLQSLSSQQPVSFEYAHPSAQGTRWVSAVVTPVVFGTSATSQCAYIAQDITERKVMEDQIRQHTIELEAEVERRANRIQELEQRRMQVEKLAALSQVAAGVAHEINNPLASIAQSLTLLKRAIPPDHPRYKYTQKMQDCIDRMTHITRQLYSLYRPTTSPTDSVEVEQVIQSALEIMRPIAHKKGIRLRSSLSGNPNPTQVGIAPADLIQILCNLIQNAVDASSPPSDIDVSITQDHQSVTISIADQGMGIAPEVLSRMFDPFYTTKYGDQGIGLGLGLAISKNIIESASGHLQCSTIQGTGTTFSIILPTSIVKQ
ncbi:MAG: PAS domain S-box protein [Nitrospirales bacterium]